MTSQNQNFSFCPECGAQTVEYRNARHWVCLSCGFDLYNNVASAVGVIIADSAGRILLIKRAHEPRKGFLALPGGFVEAGESAEEAAARECKEETGVTAQNIAYLASFPNIYVYKTVRYTTCDIFFTARASHESEIENLFDTARDSCFDGEADDFFLRKIESRADIDALQLAFPSAVMALNTYLDARRE
jgi:ADP-ribose pyrophosphatase YjhB (NUDIX family)